MVFPWFFIAFSRFCCLEDPTKFLEAMRDAHCPPYVVDAVEARYIYDGIISSLTSIWSYTLRMLISYYNIFIYIIILYINYILNILIIY